MKRSTTKKSLIPLCLLIVSSIFVLGAQPDWWTDYSLIDGSPRQDNAVASIGQAKHTVQKAYQYLDAKLEPVGGVGEELTTLHNNYCVATPVDANNDLLPLTIGQLKYLAKPFYDRLNSVEVELDTSAMNPNSADIYPWTIDQFDDNDLALATLAQLKFAFSFDLGDGLLPAQDRDDDTLLDDWEQMIVDADPNDAITVVADVLPEEDYDADGLSNQNEFIQGRDPTISDHPALEILLY